MQTGSGSEFDSDGIGTTVRPEACSVLSAALSAACAVFLMSSSLNAMERPLPPRAEMDLAGEWDVLKTQDAAAEQPPSGGTWERLQVPTLYASPRKTPCWWYRKTLTIPSEWQGRRVHLVMDGAVGWSAVYLNAKKLGEDFTLNYRLDVDLTKEINWGGPNELMIAVKNPASLYRADKPSLCKGEKASNYPGESHGWYDVIGIHQGVRLIAKDAVSVDELFIKPSYRKKRIDVDVWVKNEGDEDASVDVSGDIAEGVQLPPVKVSVPAGGRVKAVLGKEWAAPKLWQIGEPNLYWLNTKLVRDGKTLDGRCDRFGFREFWIEGTDYYFNGAKFYLKMYTLGVYVKEFYVLKTPAEASERIRGYAKDALSKNFNCIRWWFQVAGYLRDVCDEEGVVINDFIFDDQGTGVAVSEENIYWGNCTRLFDRFFAVHCNHPSVFYWTIQNEAWIYPKPGRWGELLLEQQSACARHVAEKDPTRFVNSDGDGDLSGWAEYIRSLQDGAVSAGHASGAAPQYSWHMGVGGPENPRSYYWLEEGKAPVWKKDKPLVFGEFDMNISTVFQEVAYSGDSVFSGRMKDCDPWNWYSENIRCNRVQGISGTHPWNAFMNPAAIKAFTPEIAINREFDMQFYGGQTVRRRIFVNNGTFKRNLSPLSWSLKDRSGGKTADESRIADALPCGRIELDLEAGCSKEVTVEVPLPSVGKMADMELEVKYGAYADSLPMRVYPSVKKFSTEGRKKILVFDPEGISSPALGMLLDGFEEISEPFKLDKTVDLLIIGEEGLSAETSPETIQEVRRYAENGGKVLMFQQQDSPPEGLLPIALKVDEMRQLLGRSFPVAPNHPVTSGLDQQDLRFWPSDYYVCRFPFSKPSLGSYKCLLQTSHPRGLATTPLLEIGCGSGLFLCCQMDLIEKSGRAPVADMLIRNLLKYALEYRPPAPKRAMLISDKDAAMASLFKERYAFIIEQADALNPGSLADLDIIFVDGADGKSIDRLAGSISELKQWLRKKGKTLVWHRASPGQSDMLSELAGEKIAISKSEKAFNLIKTLPEDPLLDGISMFDMYYWTFAVFPARPRPLAIIEHGVKCGAGRSLAETFSADGKAAPASGLHTVPVGDGRLLISQVMWDAHDAGSKDADLQERQDRYITMLMSNLGVANQVKPAGQDIFKISDDKAFFVDLRPFVNMGFRDDISGDGKGGWTDQGSNDMRYFPTGIRKFLGVPFDVIVPEQNGGKSCVTWSLLSPEGREKLKAGIPVNAKASCLYLLHSSAFTRKGKLAEFTVTYSDGTTEKFKINGYEHVPDWWCPNKPESSDAHIAWTGRLAYPGCPQVAMFLMRWQNPHPEKEIKTVGYEGERFYVLVAITGEKP